MDKNTNKDKAKYLSCADISEIFGVSRDQSRKIYRAANARIKERGGVTLRKVPLAVIEEVIGYKM
jgi:hypothetical protein